MHFATENGTRDILLSKMLTVRGRFLLRKLSFVVALRKIAYMFGDLQNAQQNAHRERKMFTEEFVIRGGSEENS